MTRDENKKFFPLKYSALSAFLLYTFLSFAGCYVPGSSDAGGESASISISLPAGRALSAPGTLKVSGSGMEPVTAVIQPGESTISLEVPAGTARKVELSFPLRSVTLGAGATVDLSPGRTKTVPLNLNVAATKILVPDSSNLRLVQIGDMDGTGWKAITAFDLSAAAQMDDFVPFLLDFDAQGRIYVMYFANSGLGTLPGGILRFPDIDRAAEYEIVLRSDEYPLINFGINRKENILYFFREDVPGLFAMDLTAGGAPQIVFDSDTEFDSSGYSESFSPGPMTIDSPGRIFIASVNALNNVIMRIDLSQPPGSRLLFFDPAAYNGSVPLAAAGTHMDIIVRGDFLYSSHPEATAAGSAVVAYDLDIVPRSSFGKVVTIPSSAGDFVYPFLFIRSVGPTVYLIDDDQNGSGYDRVVSFTDGTGTGWDTYGTTGTGVGKFQFMETSGL